MEQYSNQTSKIIYVIFKFMKKICVKKWKLVFLQQRLHPLMSSYIIFYSFLGAILTKLERAGREGGICL